MALTKFDGWQMQLASGTSIITVLFKKNTKSPVRPSESAKILENNLT
jgi:hypothetical protein